MTTIEIIDETIEYYRTHPRGMNSAQTDCVYLSEGGNKCAVGRCMTEQALERYGDYVGNIEDIAISTNPNLELSYLFQPQYRGHALEFWSQLQTLHDNYRMWETSKNGFNELSESGFVYVRKLKQQYAEPEPVLA